MSTPRERLKSRLLQIFRPLFPYSIFSFFECFLVVNILRKIFSKNFLITINLAFSGVNLPHVAIKRKKASVYSPEQTPALNRLDFRITLKIIFLLYLYRSFYKGQYQLLSVADINVVATVTCSFCPDPHVSNVLILCISVQSAFDISFKIYASIICTDRVIPTIYRCTVQ